MCMVLYFAFRDKCATLAQASTVFLLPASYFFHSYRKCVVENWANTSIKYYCVEWVSETTCNIRLKFGRYITKGASNMIMCSCSWRHFRSRAFMEWDFLYGLTILFSLYMVFSFPFRPRYIMANLNIAHVNMLIIVLFVLI